ncbi:MAG: hypothetical protein ACRCTA_04300, partial [Bacilli bacterium]
MFKEYDITLKDEIENYVNKLNYKEHNRSFTKMFLWKEKFRLSVYSCPDFIIFFSHFNDDFFALNPICTYDNIPLAIDFLISYFKEQDKPFKISNCLKIVKEIIEEQYEDYFIYESDRDSFDYL